jgi:hypothetical protein
VQDRVDSTYLATVLWHYIILAVALRHGTTGHVLLRLEHSGRGVASGSSNAVRQAVPALNRRALGLRVDHSEDIDVRAGRRAKAGRYRV